MKDLQQKKVTELRSDLKSLGLSTTGNKNELIERLHEANQKAITHILVETPRQEHLAQDLAQEKVDAASENLEKFFNHENLTSFSDSTEYEEENFRKDCITRRRQVWCGLPCFSSSTQSTTFPQSGNTEKNNDLEEEIQRGGDSREPEISLIEEHSDDLDSTGKFRKSLVPIYSDSESEDDSESKNSNVEGEGPAKIKTRPSLVPNYPESDKEDSETKNSPNEGEEDEEEVPNLITGNLSLEDLITEENLFLEVSGGVSLARKALESESKTTDNFKINKEMRACFSENIEEARKKSLAVISKLFDTITTKKTEDLKETLREGPILDSSENQISGTEVYFDDLDTPDSAVKKLGSLVPVYMDSDCEKNSNVEGEEEAANRPS